LENKEQFGKVVVVPQRHHHPRVTETELGRKHHSRPVSLLTGLGLRFACTAYLTELSNRKRAP
jgi:hypothetical protein